MKNRIFGAVIGLIFSLLCGLISLLSTGGGHGSLMWVFLFVVPELCGIYFPLMGFLGADLSSSTSRWIFGLILATNTIISTAIIAGSLLDDIHTIKAWDADPQGGIFVTAVHTFPFLIFITLFIVSILTAKRDNETFNATILK